jgi:hypothetical protein
VADHRRGTLMGNRGCLHDEEGTIRRFHSGKRWIFCRLEFKNRKRELMQPGRYTELFFLDEATAFAAGHRPCAECLRERFREFRDRWAGGAAVSATAVDRTLHAARIGPHRSKPTFRARIAELPDGTLVVPAPEAGQEPAARLVWHGFAWRWSFAGYTEPERVDPAAEVEVLTPRSIVAAFAAGFRPAVVTPRLA